MLHRSQLYLALLVGFSLPISAQVVRGVVVDPAGRAVSGAVVTLVDTAGSVAARQLASESGEFRLIAPRAGSYRLRTLRIGYRPTLSVQFVVGQGDVVQRIILTGARVLLDTLRIVEQSVCDARSSLRLDSLEVFQQIRTALTAAELTASARALELTMVRFERALLPGASRPTRQHYAQRVESAARTWSSLPSDSLHAAGFIVTRSNGASAYYGPGLETLLSDEFVEDHCLRVVKAGEMLGVAFTPNRRRSKIPEIRGTIWIDRATAELRRVEFAYVNASPEAEAHAGGEVDFARLRDGSWTVSRWALRVPIVEQRTSGARLGPYGGSVSVERVVKEIREGGGALIVARRTADTLWRAPAVAFHGTVRDSTSGAAIIGARLTTSGATPLAVTSDAHGAFAFGETIPGLYDVEIATPSLDSLGVTHRLTIPVLESGALEVNVPSALGAIAALCGEGRRLERFDGVIVGTLIGFPVSQPRTSTTIRAEWNVSDSTARLEATADSSGNFRICGVPANSGFRLSAITGVKKSASVAFGFPPRTRVMRVTFPFDGGDAAVIAVTGTVFADSGHRPVADALVALGDRTTTTNGRGEFRISDVPLGQHLLVVRRLGFRQADLPLDLSSATQKVVEVRLERIATLDSVKIVERAILPSFEEHRRMGLGHFLTREDLAQREGRTMSSVLAEIRGLGVVKGTANHAWVASSRPRTSLSGSGQGGLDQADLRLGAPGGQCYAQVYLDGARVYTGRDGEPLFDVNTISPDRVEGVEFYSGPAQTPNKYSGLNTGCGVLVIWTRR